MADPTEEQIRDEVFGKTEQVAHFVMEPLLDRAATDREGHKVYKPAPHVTIRAKGERDGISVPVTKEHQRLFKTDWEAFQERSTRTFESSLYHLPTIDKAVIRTLQELGIPTVERLAAAPIAERVEVVEQNSDDDNAEEIPLPGVLPAYLAKWQRIATAYLTLKQFALTGEKPRVRLEAVA
jgi:hypothetical protein